jgi:hypothetical protein
MFNQWQERNQFQNVDPSLRKKYEELLIKQKKIELEQMQRSREAIHDKQLELEQEQCRIQPEEHGQRIEEEEIQEQ